MKKIILLGLLISVLTGCSSMDYHNGRNNMLLGKLDDIDVHPLQADVKVEQQISGVAECKSWFGFLTKKPTHQTYGSYLQVPQGNFSPTACTRGAIYNALSKNNAELILAPRYTAVQKGKFCLFGICLHKTHQIIVTGYKAGIKDIRPMDEDIVKIKRKSAYSDEKQSIVTLQ